MVCSLDRTCSVYFLYFLTVIIGITESSAFLTQIGQDLRKIGGPLRGTMCLLEGI